METNQYLQLAFAFILVMALMGILALILKKMNAFQSGMTGKSNRLKIVEQRMIDTKHKAVIVRCDNKDHLVIVSQNGNTVIVQSGMTAPKEDNKKEKVVEGF